MRSLSYPLAAAVSIFLLRVAPAGATIANGTADMVMGQASFLDAGANQVTADTMNQPWAIAVDTTTGRTFVADTKNNRVLFWNSLTLGNGQTPDGVIGQPDFGGASCNLSPATAQPTAATLCDPAALSVDAASGRLWVTDAGNGRVLRYSPPFTTGMSADMVIGQANFTTESFGTTGSSLGNPYTVNPPQSGVAVDPSGNLFVSDTANNRVLVFASPLSNGATAAVVLGQNNLVTGTLTAISSMTLNNPTFLAMGPAGDVWVNDLNHIRVVHFSTPVYTGEGADKVVGQPDFVTVGIAPTQSTFGAPDGVALDPTGILWVSDRNNNRVLGFSAPISSAGASAAYVEGQTNFTSNTANQGSNLAQPGTLNYPFGLAVDATGYLYVADAYNNRIGVWLFPTATPGGGMSFALGKSNAQSTVLNPISGAVFNTPTGAVVDPGSGRLFIADYMNNRVLVWNDAATLSAGQAADVVLGQADFVSSGTNAGVPIAANTMYWPGNVAVSTYGAVFVPDIYNHRVLRFSPPFSTGMNADLVLGQANFTTGLYNQTNSPTPSASSFWYPTYVSLDKSGNLWVGDTSNNRVLGFQPPFANGMSANWVLGESNFNTNGGGLSATSLLRPYGVEADAAGDIFVNDTNACRTLEYAVPITSGMAATVVLGQPNLTSGTCATTQTGQANDGAMAFDASGNLWVVDANRTGSVFDNNRILEYVPPFTNGMAASAVIGQADYTHNLGDRGGAISANGLNRPNTLTFDNAGNMWVADSGNNRVLRFNGGAQPAAVSNLTATNVATATGTTVSLNWSQSAAVLAGAKVAVVWSTGTAPVSVSTINAQIVQTTTGAVAGASQSLLLHLAPGTAYGFNIFTISQTGWLESNAASVTTALMPPAPTGFTNGQNASTVLGSQDFISAPGGTTATTMGAGPDVITDANGNVWVLDNANTRIVRYSAPVSSGMAASLVIGEPDLVTSVSGTTASQFSDPHGAAFDAAGDLWIADHGNNRVLEFQAPLSNGMSASLVLGQSNFTSAGSGHSASTFSQPHSLKFDGNGVLWVADQRNNRVLGFVPPFSNGMNATYALGQATLRGNAAVVINNTHGVAVDPSGTVWVSDTGNSQVYGFVPPFTLGAAPAYVLGGGTSATTFSGPHGVDTDASGNVWVSDSGNGRALRFSPPFSNGMAATLVLGEPDFASTANNCTGITQSNMCNNHAVAVDPFGNAWASQYGVGRTLGFQPAGGSFTPSSSTIAMAFGSNGDPASTVYTVKVSTNSNFSSVLLTATIHQPSTTFTGLTPLTTYYFRASAPGTAYVSMGSALTLAAPPGGASPAFTGVTTSSLTFNWTSGGNAGTVLYQADISSLASFANITSSLTYNHYAGFTALQFNTSYYTRVKVLDNGSGVSSAYASAASTSTLTNGVSGPVSIVGVSTYSLTAFWHTANPAGTLFLVEADTSPAFTEPVHQLIPAAVRTRPGGLRTDSLGIPTNYMLLGLSANTTYYLQVAAVNNNGIVSAFAGPVSTTTLAAGPAPIGTAQGVSSITWTWSAVPGASGYKFYPSTGGAAIALTGTTLTQVQLSTNTGYGAALSAINVSGEGSLSSTVTAYTSAAPPYGLAAPVVNITSATVSWLANTNPASTQYLATLTPVTGTAVSSTTLNTSAAFTGLKGGTTYTFTLSALNGNGVATASTATLNVVTLPVQAAVATIVSTATTVVQFPAPLGPVTITIPPNAFSNGTVVTVVQPSTFPANVSAAASVTGTNIGIEITLSQNGAQPQAPVTIVISYAGANIGTTDPHTFVIALHDDIDNVWVPLPSTVDTSAKTVTAIAKHFSTYQIMGITPSSTVSTVRVYPNPFRPALGHTGVTFSNLPAGASVKLYTLLGEKVRDLTADGTGIAVWDGNNSSGHGAASGVYFAIATSPGAGSKTFKVAVQR